MVTRRETYAPECTLSTPDADCLLAWQVRHCVAGTAVYGGMRVVRAQEQESGHALAVRHKHGTVVVFVDARHASQMPGSAETNAGLFPIGRVRLTVCFPVDVSQMCLVPPKTPPSRAPGTVGDWLLCVCPNGWRCRGAASQWAID